MKDTRENADTHMSNLLAARSPAERFAMACRMLETARTLVRAGIIAECGTAAEAHMRKHLFLRFYGDDFAEEKKRRILASWGED
jgi:hypothetical protein